MIDYRAGSWGFHVAFHSLSGSLAPRALTVAIPNALLTFAVATYFLDHDSPELKYVHKSETTDAAQKLVVSFTTVLIFILHNRSRTSYNRWWEGGTLIQKTRGEWFNAYSSVMSFTSTKPELQDEVEAYTHLLARLMSLLMCCGLQQVSPNRDRPFEIIDLDGIEPESMEFLNSAPDKVEIILQWIQRSMVLHAQTGVLPVAPPILSRAFQEVSRGIVNLQNARKIADFPYPFPLAQISMVLQMIHYFFLPVSLSFAVPRGWAVIISFSSIFVLWSIHFNALDLEFPFGTRVNDLPMTDFQLDWNKSLITLLDKRATRPPLFSYDPIHHPSLPSVMSDASDLYIPITPAVQAKKGVATITVKGKRNAVRMSTTPEGCNHDFHAHVADAADLPNQIRTEVKVEDMEGRSASPRTLVKDTKHAKAPDVEAAVPRSSVVVSTSAVEPSHVGEKNHHAILIGYTPTQDGTVADHEESGPSETIPIEEDDPDASKSREGSRCRSRTTKVNPCGCYLDGGTTSHA